MRQKVIEPQNESAVPSNDTFHVIERIRNVAAI